MKPSLLLLLACTLLLVLDPVSTRPAPADDAAAADLIVHNGKLVTVDAKFSIAEAVAVKDGKIVAAGTGAEILKRKGPKTRLIDAKGKTVLPGLYDSHTHPTGAAGSEIGEPVPNLPSIPEVQDYIRKKAATLPKGQWIILRYAFPTRLKEARFPTKAELDAAAPDHPVLYHAGPAGITNSMGLKVSGITKDTKSPRNGQVVKDPKTGEPNRHDAEHARHAEDFVRRRGEKPNSTATARSREETVPSL
jgi:predicted amidohydrolase YtcJ